MTFYSFLTPTYWLEGVERGQGQSWHAPLWGFMNVPAGHSDGWGRRHFPFHGLPSVNKRTLTFKEHFFKPHAWRRYTSLIPLKPRSALFARQSSVARWAAALLYVRGHLAPTCADRVKLHVWYLGVYAVRVKLGSRKNKFKSSVSFRQSTRWCPQQTILFIKRAGLIFSWRF